MRAEWREKPKEGWDLPQGPEDKAQVAPVVSSQELCKRTSLANNKPGFGATKPLCLKVETVRVPCGDENPWLEENPWILILE